MSHHPLRTTALVGLLGCGSLALLGLPGCITGAKNNNQPNGNAATLTSDTLTGGADAIAGLGSDAGSDDDDIVLFNGRIRAVIDRPGSDGGTPGGAFPLQNILAASGGTLIDLSIEGKDNDQFNQMSQGLVGIRTVDTGTTGSADGMTSSTNDLFIDALDPFGTVVTVNAGGVAVIDSSTGALVDVTTDFFAAGVQAGDTLNVLSGANVTRTFTIAGVVSTTTVLATIPDGETITADTGVSYSITRNTVAAGDILTITSGANAGESFRVGSVAASLPSGAPSALVLFVQEGRTYTTDSFPPPGSISYAITRTTNPLDNLVVYDTVDLVFTFGDPATVRVTGGVLNQGGDLIDGTTVSPLTSRVQAIGADLVVTTEYRLFRDTEYVTVSTALTNSSGTRLGITALADLVITGGLGQANLSPWTPFATFQALGLDTATVVPFASFRGRGEPEASYTVVDALTGHMIHLADGEVVAANIQLSTSTGLDSGATQSWLRQVIVGDKNDVASSANLATELLGFAAARVNPSTGGTLPNGYEGAVSMLGQVFGAPPGTQVTVSQVSPGLAFSAGAPNGLTAETGFVPATLLGVPELPLMQAKVDEIGAFKVVLPTRFAGRAPDATLPADQDLFFPPGFEDGAETRYRLTVDAPGANPQSVVIEVPGRGVRQLNNLLFDLDQEYGTIEVIVTDDASNPIPATVLVRGMDPDGPLGPTAATPNPVFGGTNGVGIDDPRALGRGDNLVRLVDGRGLLRVRPGAYQVIASRGLEYSIARFPRVGAARDFFTVGANQTVQTITTGTTPDTMVLTRLLDAETLTAPGGGGTFTNPLKRYVSADLRVRSQASFDLATPARDRVTEFLAAGVEVLVSAENDNLFDMSSSLSALDDESSQDLSLLMQIQQGTQTNGLVPVNVPAAALGGFSLVFPNTAGGFTGFPITNFDSTLRRNGALADEFRGPTINYEQLRSQGASLIMMNLPRSPVADFPLPPIGFGFLTNGKEGFPQPNRGNAALQSGGYLTPLRSSNGTAQFPPLVPPPPSATAFPPGDGGLEDLLQVRTTSGTRRIDFDLLEVDAGNTTLFDIAKLDFYSLTSAGFPKTAVATSEVSGIPGFPRTYVATPGSDDSANVGALDLAEFNNALRPRLVPPASPRVNTLIDDFTAVPSSPATVRTGAGDNDQDVLTSSGPIVYLEVDANNDGTFEAQPGDIVTPTGATITARITVFAAPWVPVTSATVFANGQSNSAADALIGGNAALLTAVGALDLTEVFDQGTSSLIATVVPNPTDEFSSSPNDVVRLRATVTIPVPTSVTLPGPLTVPLRDYYIGAEARGSIPANSIFRLLVPDLGGDAVGFSNPIYIDANGDGDWDPPGVP